LFLALLALLPLVAGTGPFAPASAGPGTVRRYFIAADQVRWDYAPAARNLITGKAFSDDESVFVQNGPDRIGSTYLKSLYREYTDASFTHLKPRPAEWEHLGDLGPVIRAEVGDTIEVVFKNQTPFPASIHPHGVFYAKSSEGAPYADGTSGTDKADDRVAPGDSVTYHWSVPERAGPGPMDASSIMWMYHSHVDEAADTSAGLMGPMIITAKGKARADGSPKDVDREVVANFEVDDENASRWAGRNIAAFPGNPKSVDPDDDGFVESNLMHSINGFVYGNLPGLTMKVGERVRWYVMAMGTEVDLHTPHWHGNTVTWMGMRTDVVSLMPAQMIVADMVPDDPGVWQYHCHVADHIAAGMQALYTVS
jgi:hephaestin